VIPVVVPPGVREAHHGFRRIDLRIPETSLVHTVLERGVVLADRPERVRVLAYVVAPHGAARRGDAPTFEVSRGSVAVVEREPGAFEGTWALPPGRAGEERIVVRLPAAIASRAVARVEAVPGPAAVVAVSFDRDPLVAGAADGVAVTARALDAAGNPVPAYLELSADGGELADVREREPGELLAWLRVGPAFGARREVRVTASAPGTGIAGARTLALRAGEPAVARFQTGDGVVRGGREARLRVAVADWHGNGADTAPAVTAERGKVLAVAAAAPGTWEVRYLAPAVAALVPERLVASAGGIHATAERLLVPAEAPLAFHPSAGFAMDLRGRFMGVSVGAALEAPADVMWALRRSVALSWRAEAEALWIGGHAAAVLGGASAAHDLGSSRTLAASASVGVFVARGGAAPAGRLAVEARLDRGARRPFAQAAILAAADGPPGAFGALVVSAGVRMGMERRNGQDPHRR
jgi:hypothetical protein